jgi:hypothetical protein
VGGRGRNRAGEPARISVCRLIDQQLGVDRGYGWKVPLLALNADGRAAAHPAIPALGDRPAADERTVLGQSCTGEGDPPAEGRPIEGTPGERLLRVGWKGDEPPATAAPGATSGYDGLLHGGRQPRSRSQKPPLAYRSRRRERDRRSHQCRDPNNRNDNALHSRRVLALQAVRAKGHLAWASVPE